MSKAPTSLKDAWLAEADAIFASTPIAEGEAFFSMEVREHLDVKLLRRIATTPCTRISVSTSP